jgi:hypothetical protein
MIGVWQDWLEMKEKMKDERWKMKDERWKMKDDLTAFKGTLKALCVLMIVEVVLIDA